MPNKNFEIAVAIPFARTRSETAVGQRVIMQGVLGRRQ